MKQAAEVIKENSPTDVIRWGGEEFIIITEGIEKEEIIKYAENIRQKISELKINGIEEKLTISIGMSAEEWGEGSSLTQLIKTADNNLNKAKRTGKNKVFGF